MSDGLKSKTLRGLLWSFFELAGQQGIQFTIMVILARLLAPDQFGLIGMLTIFIAVGQSFINSGFGQALIRKKDITHIDECSVFYFNVLVGVVAAGVLCAVAPLIAGFYGQPVLTSLARVLSLNLVINSFGLVQTTLLTKRIDFKTQMKISVSATILSGGIGVGMALNGFGVWSLVAQSLSMNLFRTVFLWLFNAWRPSLAFSTRSLREMFGFGSRLLASGLLDTIFQNIYLVVIGKLFSAESLGFYAQANKIQQLPAASFSSVISRVTFPVFSTIQTDPARMKNGMRKAMRAMAFVNFPMMVGLAVAARPLVLVLLTDKWAPSVHYLQLLCVIGLLYPLHVINLNILQALGRSDLFFRLEVIKKSLTIASIALTYHFGITTMIWGQIVVSVFGYYLNSYYTGKLIRYPFSEQIVDVLPYLALAALMGGGVYGSQWIPMPCGIAALALQVSVGILFYIALSFLLRFSAFVEAWDIAGQKIKPRILCREVAKRDE